MGVSVCIIGAGTAGLCCARHAKAHDLEPTIFEASNCVGGTWVYNENVGTINGIDVHSSMYANLRSNLPKEIMGFPDFKIGDVAESYVPSQSICDFLNQYADYYNIRQYIKFNSYVVRILYKQKKWQVIVKDLLTSNVEIHNFDKIMVANGHYHTPMYANIPNAHLFKGNYLHSHDFRTSDIFKGQSVLVIGAGPSGMDLANIISHSARRVTLSHHLKGISKTKFFDNVYQKSDVKEFDEKGAYFTSDNSYEEFDTIFFCTGYKYAFPFLSVNCGIFVEDNYVQELYKHCINIRNPSMALIGLPFYVCAAQMMDIQARFVLSYFSGNNKLPSTEEMLADTDLEMNRRWKKGLKKRHAHMLGPDQLHYFNDLAKTAQIKTIPPVMTKLHNESSNCFNENLLTFREDIFKLIDEETFIKIN
ncbi:senecionine N-oxygenase [Scaptodrosophila lebanonensis]|uniref:Flavin-containing monooxygenase n=1 Tax=Drosophila lebanonensis TaxID=7225 RepID=A0A6J2TKK2_DROLE|nr:senecionine N-oxygenase [Scaptodrosophila lebanonensis]